MDREQAKRGLVLENTEAVLDELPPERWPLWVWREVTTAALEQTIRRSTSRVRRLVESRGRLDAVIRRALERIQKIS